MFIVGTNEPVPSLLPVRQDTAVDEPTNLAMNNGPADAGPAD